MDRNQTEAEKGDTVEVTYESHRTGSNITRTGELFDFLGGEDPMIEAENGVELRVDGSGRVISPSAKGNRVTGHNAEIEVVEE